MNLLAENVSVNYQVLQTEYTDNCPFIQIEPKELDFKRVSINSNVSPMCMSICQLKDYYSINQLNVDKYNVLNDCYVRNIKSMETDKDKLFRMSQYQKFKIRNINCTVEDDYILKFDRSQLNDCPELIYSCDTIDFLQENEFKSLIWPGQHLKDVYPISLKYRKKMVSFLMSCHIIFNTEHETYQNAISLFDQCMYRMGQQDFQTCNKVALMAFFISHKLEEINYFSMARMIDACGNKFSELELSEIEKKIINVLDFNIYHPVPINYLRTFVLIDKPPKFKHVYEIAKFFLDICFLHNKFAGYPFSISSSVSYCIALFIVNGGTINEYMWKDYLRNLTGITWNDIHCHINRMIRIFDELVQKQNYNLQVAIHKAHTTINKMFVRDLLTMFYEKTLFKNNAHLNHCGICNYNDNYKSQHYEK